MADLMSNMKINRPRSKDRGFAMCGEA